MLRFVFRVRCWFLGSCDADWVTARLLQERPRCMHCRRVIP